MHVLALPEVFVFHHMLQWHAALCLSAAVPNSIVYLACQPIRAGPSSQTQNNKQLN